MDAWWGLVLVSAVYFLALALNVMPAYSRAVLMGGDYKPHVLPAPLAGHFASVASERRAASEAWGAARGRLARLVSRAAPRQADASGSGRKGGGH